jgi:hypothetical protein
MSCTISLNSTALANGAADARQSPANLRIDVREVVQPVKRIRAAKTLHLPRANTETTVSFETTVEHTSADLAIAACITPPPKSGNLDIVVTGGGTRRMTGAVLVDHSHSHIGVSSFHRYSIAGGELETVVP